MIFIGSGWVQSDPVSNTSEKQVHFITIRLTLCLGCKKYVMVILRFKKDESVYTIEQPDSSCAMLYSKDIT